MTWITLFDFGILNGVVIAISEAYGKNDRQLAAGYAGTAFIFLAASTIVIGFVLIVLIQVLPLEVIFGLPGDVNSADLRQLVLAATLPLVVFMPFSIVKQLYAGYQKSYVGNLFAMAGSVITIIVLLVAVRSRANLQAITVLYLGLPGIFLAINYFVLTRFEMPWLSLNFSLFSRKSLRRIFRSSIPLFLFQFGALLVNQTQPLVLAHRTSLETVADYAAVIRLQQAITSVILVSTVAFTPSFREASERGEQDWVRKAFRRMLAIRSGLAILFGFLFVIAGNAILQFWLGEGQVELAMQVWIALAILMFVSTWVTAYSDLLVIMDQIWIQVLLVLVNGGSILVLTYLTAPIYGVFGAIVATAAFSVTILAWLLPILAKPILYARDGIEIAEL
jgi:O-antigen/teichoic acid export membrane protein